jgi:tetrahydromethanopterin S-methyltransferase subunit G
MLEVNFMENPKKWWIDIGVTYHVCFDIILFLVYNNLLMENNYSRTTP